MKKAVYSVVDIKKKLMPIFAKYKIKKLCFLARMPKELHSRIVI